MFSIATPSEVRPVNLPVAEVPARQLVRLGRLLLEVDSGVNDVSRLLGRAPSTGLTGSGDCSFASSR